MGSHLPDSADRHLPRSGMGGAQGVRRVGMIGPGQMGRCPALWLLGAGLQIVVWAPSPDPVEEGTTVAGGGDPGALGHRRARPAHRPLPSAGTVD